MSRNYSYSKRFDPQYRTRGWVCEVRYFNSRTRRWGKWERA